MRLTAPPALARIFVFATFVAARHLVIDCHSMGQELPARSLSTAKQRMSQFKDGDLDIDGKNCGISCLYLFLKLHGIEAKYSAIEELVPLEEEGASLHSLAEASRRLGYSAVPVRCSPAHLASLPLPVIAHLEVFSADKPYLHYVVITEVQDSEITLFDPIDNEVSKVHTSQLSAILSGHFLSSTTRPFARPATFLAAAGILLLGWGGRQMLKGRRVARLPATESKAARLGPIGVAIGLLTFLPGCDRGATEAASHGIDNKPNPIVAEQTRLDLGLLERNVDAIGEFKFRNTSSQPVQIKLGQPSCTCLRVELKSKDTLEPGESGGLMMFLDTANQFRAGKMEACVPLETDSHSEPLTFCVKGILEGITFPREKYVVRPAQLRERKIPAFRFELVTQSDREVKITAITCVSLEELRDLYSKDFARIQTDLPRTKPAAVVAELAHLTISAPRQMSEEAVYIRSVEVPMGLHGSPEAFAGKIIVDYLVGEKALQAATELLVLGKSDT